MHAGKVVHYRISETDKGVSIGPGRICASIQVLIENYREKVKVLCVWGDMRGKRGVYQTYIYIYMCVCVCVRVCVYYDVTNFYVYYLL